MSEELKPCPFCGGPPAAGCAGVSCNDCHPADGLGFVANTWQSRPIEDALRADVAALKARMARYEGPLTDEQKTTLVETCPKTALTLSMSRHGWDIVDSAIRKVRGEG